MKLPRIALLLCLTGLVPSAGAADETAKLEPLLALATSGEIAEEDWPLYQDMRCAALYRALTSQPSKDAGADRIRAEAAVFENAVHDAAEASGDDGFFLGVVAMEAIDVMQESYEEDGAGTYLKDGPLKSKSGPFGLTAQDYSVCQNAVPRR